MVEGLDVNSALPDIVENYDVNKLINEEGGIDRTNFNNNQNFNEQLDNIAGYDLVFIDWGNGVGDIPGNAKCLEQALDALQARKNVNSQNNVIVGISMGGLISRYCLADMVKRIPRKATNTRLLITMDSPHQGAYIPLAFQHLTMTLPDVIGPRGIRLGSILNSTLDRVKNNLLLSAGAQQQLKLLVTNSTGTVAQNTFLTNTYRPKITFTNPSIQPEYDFRAISNGSQCGKNVMSPGASLAVGSASVNASGAAITVQLLMSLSLTGIPFAVVTKLKYKLDLNANALNGISSHEILYFRLKREGKLFFIINNDKTFVEIQRNEPTINSIPWESVPGGTQSLGNRFNPNSNNISANWSFIAPWFLGYNFSVTMAPVWSFVAVTSALDIQNPSSQNGQYVYPINGQNGSTATRYIAQETTTGFSNINHTNFTARNARWLYEELQGISHTTDCSDVCIAELTITGPSEACSGTYSVPSIAGATYVWQISPAGAIYLTPPPGSNSISIGTFRNKYEKYTVSVTLYKTQGSSQCIYGQGSKVIQLGLKPPHLAGPYDPVSNGELIVGYPNVNHYFNAYESSIINGPFTYSWTLTPPNNGPLSYYSGQTPTITFPTIGNYSLSLKKQSASCGSVTVTRTIVIQPNYGRLIVGASPNPANTSVEKSFKEIDRTSSGNH
jgi:orotate phosphoribosyltransferase